MDAPAWVPWFRRLGGSVIATALLAAPVGCACGTTVGLIAGVLIGEGGAQRAHQEDVKRFLLQVINEDPEYGNLEIEFGSGTQIFVVGYVSSQEVYDRLSAEMVHRFGEQDGKRFIYQVEIYTPPAKQASTATEP